MMNRKKPLTPEERQLIETLKNAGVSKSAIAAQLQCSVRTVQYYSRINREIAAARDAREEAKASEPVKVREVSSIKPPTMAQLMGRR